MNKFSKIKYYERFTESTNSGSFKLPDTTYVKYLVYNINRNYSIVPDSSNQVEISSAKNVIYVIDIYYYNISSLITESTIDVDIATVLKNLNDYFLNKNYNIVEINSQGLIIEGTQNTKLDDLYQMADTFSNSVNNITLDVSIELPKDYIFINDLALSQLAKKVKLIINPNSDLSTLGSLRNIVELDLEVNDMTKIDDLITFINSSKNLQKLKTNMELSLGNIIPKDYILSQFIPSDSNVLPELPETFASSSNQLTFINRLTNIELSNIKEDTYTINLLAEYLRCVNNISIVKLNGNIIGECANGKILNSPILIQSDNGIMLKQTTDASVDVNVIKSNIIDLFTQNNLDTSLFTISVELIESFSEVQTKTYDIIIRIIPNTPESTQSNYISVTTNNIGKILPVISIQSNETPPNIPELPEKKREHIGLSKLAFILIATIPAFAIILILIIVLVSWKKGLFK